jgi:hypothetical protein
MKRLTTLPSNYRDILLSLSDDMKLSAINLLSESLLHRSPTVAEVDRSKPVSQKTFTFSPETVVFIKSLGVTGGEPVPADINDIGSLIDEKHS